MHTHWALFVVTLFCVVSIMLACYFEKKILVRLFGTSDENAGAELSSVVCIESSKSEAETPSRTSDDVVVNPLSIKEVDNIW